jgi:uncharacterized membrane protein YfbV (UPF0208 family)
MSTYKERTTRRRNPSIEPREVIEAVRADLWSEGRKDLEQLMQKHATWVYAVASKALAEAKPVPTRRTTPTFDDSADVARIRTKLFNVIAELSE